MRSQLLSEKTGSNIVIEFGSTYLRGGFAGEYLPRFTIPSPFKGYEHKTSDELRVLCLEVTRNLFQEHLQVKSKDCNIVIVESLFADKCVREQLFTTLLQDMQALNVSFQPDMLMAMLPTGCSMGIVLDIGSTECRAMAIAHGRPVLASFTATPIGVQHAYKRFHNTLQMLWGTANESHDMVPLPLDSKYTEDLFERLVVACEYSVGQDVMVRGDVRVVNSEGNGSISSQLPPEDERVVPGWLRSDCLHSLLFGNEGTDTECADEIGGAVGCVLSSLLRCSTELRRPLIRHVVVCGGGADIPGVAAEVWKRLGEVATGRGIEESGEGGAGEQSCNYLNALRYHSLRNLLSPAPSTPLASPDGETAVIEGELDGTAGSEVDLSNGTLFCRSHLAWVGGSLFASIKSNKSRYVTREEFQMKQGGVLSGSSAAALRISTPVGKGRATAAMSSPAVSRRTTPGDESDHHFRIPDWTSTDPSDWRFYGARGIAGT